MNNPEQSMQHHAFITTTDRKSLYTQLSNLVQQAEQVAKKELEKRRNSLKLLLEYEDEIYEEEFANKVKSRIDEDIRERKDNLLKIKEESTKNELEFLKSKRIQQNMNSCYEIREVLRHKETLNIKECQLKQMLEKERLVKNEKELEEYWLKVQEANLKFTDGQQMREDCLKKALVKQVAGMRRTQVEEKKEKLERENLEKLQEKIRIDALLEELRLEAFNKNINKKSAQTAQYRNELLKMMNEKEINETRKYQEEVALQQQLMKDIVRETADKASALREKKKAFYQATMDFIKFVKGLRQLEEEQEQLRNNRVEELRRIDMCTKRNILLERQRKAHKAEQCYAALRQQICDQSKLRLQEEAEYRECKMLENRFVHNDKSRADILAAQRKFREELDKQIDELKQIRQTEETKFSRYLQRASNDPELCDELAKKYIKEGIDYLQPHPNSYLLKSKSSQYSVGQGAVPKKNLESCSKTHKKTDDGRGDEKTR